MNGQERERERERRGHSLLSCDGGAGTREAIKNKVRGIGVIVTIYTNITPCTSTIVTTTL